MNFIGTLLQSMEFGSAGSEDTSRRVLDLCGLRPSVLNHNAADATQKSIFVGDNCFTPSLLAERMGGVVAAFSDEVRVQRAAAMGLRAVKIEPFELPRTEGGYDFIWYDSSFEPDGTALRLAQIRSALKKGGAAVYRTLCWLIDPSPDTVGFCERRFGAIDPFDTVIAKARKAGFSVQDFYIAPKSDWREGVYEPLSKAAQEHGDVGSDEAETGRSLLKKEMDMFELHCEEYSYVYYILKG